MQELTRRLGDRARTLGFSLVGVTPADPSDQIAFYRSWLERGMHGEMTYLARDESIARRADLSSTLESVRSVVVVGHEYYTEDDPRTVADPSRGLIARYARGRDYHAVVKKKLLELLRWLEGQVEGGVGGRVYVDTGPILERDLARRAGLGWFGRNTMLIHPQRGSYFFLGLLLVDVELEPTEPFERDHCGSCRACLDACPTGALLGRDEHGAPVMDARRCISYLTIEHRGPIPLELRPAIGNRIYGCDICQEVCPFNVRFARESAEPGYASRGPGERPVGVEALPGERDLERDGAAGEAEALRGGDVSAETGQDVSLETRGRRHVHPGTEAPSLIDLMRMTREEWNAFSRGSAIRRAGYAGFKRNVAVAIGNWLASAEEPPEEALAVLRDAVEHDEPLVGEHAAWALERTR